MRFLKVLSILLLSGSLGACIAPRLKKQNGIYFTSPAINENGSMTYVFFEKCLGGQERELEREAEIFERFMASLGCNKPDRTCRFSANRVFWHDQRYHAGLVDVTFKLERQ